MEIPCHTGALVYFCQGDSRQGPDSNPIQESKGSGTWLKTESEVERCHAAFGGLTERDRSVFDPFPESPLVLP